MSNVSARPPGSRLMLPGTTRAPIFTPLSRNVGSDVTFAAIGERLYVSKHTVKTQAISIYRKLGASSRSDAVRQAQQLGLLSQ